MSRLAWALPVWSRIKSKERIGLDDIRLWCAARDDCLWLDRVEVYRPCRAAGVVQKLRIDPREGFIEATITDGVASLNAQWAIIRAAPQLGAVPGTGLILDGVARVGSVGELLMVEPSFEIVPGPEYE